MDSNTAELAVTTDQARRSSHGISGKGWVACSLFLIPLVLDGPQIVVGSIVNFTLVLLATYTPRAREMVFACILPSLGAIVNGVIFGPFTAAIIPLLPFIWSGNIALVGCTRGAVSHDTPIKVVFGWVTVSIVVKILVVASGAFLLVLSGVLPEILLPPFSIMQAITAAIGAGSCHAIMRARFRLGKSWREDS